MAAYGALGVGALGAAVGVAFGIRTVVLKSDGDALCEGALCQSERGVDLQERARASATVTTTAVGVGLAGLAVGVVLWATLPRATRTALRTNGLTVLF
ncbi:MAG: hypothetical protein EOP08_15905 [Proteobacteria bacterium]|nr:MAG: hypothetical protein EOP08_15905 [Pseudomonadota bacterium]